MPFPYPQDTNSTLPTRLLFFYRSYIPRRNGCPESSRVLTILQILKHFSARLRKAKVNSAAEARREICNSDFSDRFLLCPYFHVTLSLSLSLSYSCPYSYASSFSTEASLLLFLSWIYGESFIDAGTFHPQLAAYLGNRWKSHATLHNWSTLTSYRSI